MSEPIYTGWGTRTRVKGAIKQSITNASIRRNAANLEPTAKALQAELTRLGLHTEQGLLRLAEIMSADILTTLGADERSVSALPFHHHLTHSIAVFMDFEDLFEFPGTASGTGVQTRSDLWLMEEELGRLHRILTNFDEITANIAEMFCVFVKAIVRQHPHLLMDRGSGSGSSSSSGSDPASGSSSASGSQSGSESSSGAGTQLGTPVRDLAFSVPMAEALTDLPDLMDVLVQLPFAPELEPYKITEQHRRRLEYNVVIASGGNPGDPFAVRKALSNPRMPSRAFPMSAAALVETYLAGTALQGFMNFPVPVPIPLATRFEHQHIVAGSGHGKSQTLQHLILHDLEAVHRGQRSIVVLDSQGDLIGNISELSIFAPGGPLADRLVLIDPTDVEYPVALNLFDVGMERIKGYSQLEQERTINGVLELYDFVLGSLLDAGMTQKQSVIFRYITRLMLQIPNATIATFRELLGEGGTERYRPYIERLTGSARDFFETEFDSREFAQTKKQVLRRLWGILENQTFERMFLHPKSKLDLYAEMNAGKVILINTAKDLLKEEGTEFFGRFFIAMIAQAAQERSVIPTDERMPTMVYVDEAADYFDRNVGLILSQARKYKVGMVLAHQFLGQLDSKLQDGVFANTSIKFAGGVSSKDARTLAGEMRTDARLIEQQDKLELAAYVRGVTKGSVNIKIEPGQMEALPKMTPEEKAQQRDWIRERYAVPFADVMRAAAEQRNGGANCAAGMADAADSSNHSGDRGSGGSPAQHDGRTSIGDDQGLASNPNNDGNNGYQGKSGSQSGDPGSKDGTDGNQSSNTSSTDDATAPSNQRRADDPQSWD